jgi:hypothetical protein
LKPIIKIENIDINKIVTTRNYLTHYDKEDKSNSIEFKDLYPYVIKLSLILASIILKEIGLNEEEIELYIDKKKYFNSVS